MALLLCYHYTEQYTEFVGTFIIYSEKGIETITINNTTPISYDVGMSYQLTPTLSNGVKDDVKLQEFRSDAEAVRLYNKRYKYRSISADIGAWIN